MPFAADRVRLVSLIACLAWSLSAGAAGPADSNDELHRHPEMRGTLALLDAWAEGVRVYDRVPGLSVGLVRGTDLVWSRGYGYANPETRQPADENTLYSICSISKLFTSIGVMQLRDAGELRLDDPVERHLDWYDIEQTHPDGGPVTVRSLLTHSSGLPRESDYPYWVGPDFPFPEREAVIERLGDQQTLYPADSVFQYSNLALTLAGEIIAAVSGRSYADYVQAHILDPIGLDDTRPWYPDDLRGTQLAIGHTGMHRSGTRDVVAPFHTRGITPAAGFTSSVKDLARFASWQFATLDRAAEGRAAKVLDPNTLREMQRVHWVNPDWVTTWGLGFEVKKVDDMTVVGHGGGCPGYITHFAMVPRDRIAAIALTNAGDGPASRITQNLLTAYRAALSRSQEPPEEPPPDLSAYEGNFEARPWGGELAVRQRGSELIAVSLPADDFGSALTRLKPVAEGTFVRITDQGDEREPWVFETGDDGRTERIRVHSIHWRRID